MWLSGNNLVPNSSFAKSDYYLAALLVADGKSEYYLGAWLVAGGKSEYYVPGSLAVGWW